MGNPGVPDKALGPLGGFDIPGQFITIGRDFHNSNSNMRDAWSRAAFARSSVTYALNTLGVKSVTALRAEAQRGWSSAAETRDPPAV
jgi:hypothetical protein